MDRTLLDHVVESQLEALGTQGINKVMDMLGEKIASSDGWKKDIYTLVANAVDSLGPVGINKALNAIHDLIDGKTVDLDWADLESVSNLLAHLENQEADERDATCVFLTQVGGIVKDIVAGAIMALV